MSVRAVIYFFENVFDYKYFILSVGCLFILAFVVCAALLATVSNLAKIRRGHKRANKFFRWNAVLFEKNNDAFYKKVIRSLPIKARKQWRTASKYYDDYCSIGFKNMMTESVRTGGNSTFVVYVSIFITGLIAIIIAAMLMGGNTSEYAPMMSFTVAGGAGGLLLLATELYYLDKFADKHSDDFVTTVASRILRNSENEFVETPLVNDIFKDLKPSESLSIGIDLNKRKQIIQQSLIDGNYNCSNFNEYFTDTVSDDSAEAEYEEIEAVYELSDDDNVFENTDIINKCPSVDESKTAQCPRKEFELPVAGAKDILSESDIDDCEAINLNARYDSVKDVYKRSNVIDLAKSYNNANANNKVTCIANKRSEDFEGLNKLLDYEERLNAMQNVNKIINERKSDKDSISKLENLINGIIADGVSDALLRDVYSALNEIEKYDYNNPLDKIRVKCLIRRLENAI